MSGLTSLFGALRRSRGARVALVRFDPSSAAPGGTPTPDAEILAAGTQDALVEILERVPGVDVLGPVSSRAAARGPLEPRDAADELGADVLLIGRLSCEGETIHAEARLVAAPGGGEIWRGDFAGHVSEIFDVHGQIALEVARTLGVTPPVSGEGLIHREPTSDMRAYRAYLEGRALLRSAESSEELGSALERFETAVERDTLFAGAWTGIADAYRIADERHRTLGPAGGVATVRETAERALELDPSSADARVLLGYVDLGEWRLAEAERHLKVAIELAPAHAQAHRRLSRCLCHGGRLDEARVFADRAATLEPLDPTILNESGWPYALAGEPEKAVERSRGAVRLDAEHVMTYFHLGKYAQQSGRGTEAVTYFRAATELSGSLPFLTAFLGIALIGVGDRHEAEDIASDLERKAHRGSPVATCLAVLLVRLGRTDEAMTWFDAALVRREPLMLMADTRWLPLPEVRDDARFRTLVERLPPETTVARIPVSD